MKQDAHHAFATRCGVSPTPPICGALLMPGVRCREQCLVFERRDAGLMRISNGIMKQVRCVSCLVHPHRHLNRVSLRGKGSRLGSDLKQSSDHPVTFGAWKLHRRNVPVSCKPQRMLCLLTALPQANLSHLARPLSVQKSQKKT